MKVRIAAQLSVDLSNFVRFIIAVSKLSTLRLHFRTPEIQRVFF